MEEKFDERKGHLEKHLDELHQANDIADDYLALQVRRATLPAPRPRALTREQADMMKKRKCGCLVIDRRLVRKWVYVGSAVVTGLFLLYALNVLIFA